MAESYAPLKCFCLLGKLLNKIIRRNSLYLALFKIFDVARNDVICTYFSSAFILQAIFKIMEVFSCKSRGD